MPDGSVVNWPSRDAKESIEDVFPYELEHALRARIIPAVRDWYHENVRKPIYDKGSRHSRDMKHRY